MAPRSERVPTSVAALFGWALVVAPAPVVAADADGDGYDFGTQDCDDLRADVYPGADERCDGLDTDCDTQTPADEVDLDADAVLRCAGDCDDADARVRPGAEERCDGVDTDCLGGPALSEIDSDGDGFAPCAGDCDDDAPTDRPLGLEVCDGADNDCDAIIDEGCAPAEPPARGCEARGCGWSAPGAAAWLGLLALAVRAGSRRWYLRAPERR